MFLLLLFGFCSAYCGDDAFRDHLYAFSMLDVTISCYSCLVTMFGRIFFYYCAHNKCIAQTHIYNTATHQLIL